MLKKIAAFGLSAALVLSPLAAFAQTDTTTPGRSRRRRRSPDTMAKPMKAKPTHHAQAKHMSNSKMKKPWSAPSLPAAPRRPRAAMS